MAIVLHLGVVDVAYTEQGKPTTTGDVAEILEQKYSVMQTFVDLHEDDIADAIAFKMAGLLESAVKGDPVNVKNLEFPQVDTMFRDYLDAGEWEQQKGNMPTMAAVKGVKRSKKQPFKKTNKTRPSFIDTGLYQSSFRSWVDKK